MLTGHPFDLIKVKMQTGATSADASVFSLLRQTLMKEVRNAKKSFGLNLFKRFSFLRKPTVSITRTMIAIIYI